MGYTWEVWVSAVLISFGVLEGIVLYGGRVDLTLSAALRRWMGVSPNRSWRAPAAVALGAGLTLFFCHVVLEWP